MVIDDEAHFRSLETLYASAPINTEFSSTLHIVSAGKASIRFAVDPRWFHAAGAAHGTHYFKMLDDAAFYAANSLETGFFLLTTAFSLHFERPMTTGSVIAEGNWISGRRRLFVAESRLVTTDGSELARGTGTFMCSRIPLRSLKGYAG